MMHYAQLYKNYMEEIGQVLSAYQMLYEGKSLPKHRAEDIAAFYETLVAARDENGLKQGMMAVIKDMKTGLFLGDWHLIETGESRLVAMLLKVINKPCYSILSFKQARINELEYAVLRQEVTQDLGLSLSDASKDLEEALIKAKEKIIRLQNKLTRQDQLAAQLREQNQSLMRRNHGLYEKNQSLRIQLDKAMKGVVPNSDDDYLSPTDEIYQSFNEFAQGYK